MKRIGLMLAAVVIFAAVFALTVAPSGVGSVAHANPPLQATPTKGPNIGPENPTPTPPKPTVKPQPGDGINGTPVAPPPFDPPASLDDLLVTFPDLAPYLDQVKDLTADQFDFAELYSRVIAIYEAEGASGVAAFLKDSGILEKLNIPLAYLDLLIAFDEGGLEAVEKLAAEREYINKNGEIVGYLGVDEKANYDALKADLETRLGVAVYDYLLDTDEVEIGIALDLLAQYQTPGSLLGYLVQVATAPHVISFRGTAPVSSSLGPKLQGSPSVGAVTMGADKWHAAGITGKGMKVGILDMGFGGIKDLLGTQLPSTVTANVDLDELNVQDNNHGTACAAVVHGIAPDAEIVIAYFDNGSDVSFFAALDFLAAQKVDIVNYSVARLIGPRDGSSPSSQLSEEFMRQTGALWVNSAGNYATSHTVFTFNEGKNKAHFFDTDVNLLPFMAFSPVTAVAMNWDGNWAGGEKSEYNFLVLDSAGKEIVSAAEIRNGKRTHYPFQITGFSSTPGEIYYLYITRTRGTVDNVIDIVIPNADFVPWAQVPLSSVAIPGDAGSVLTVGAVGLSNDVLESYSSQGPTADSRIKPDVTAPTNEVVAGYTNGFSGTSGAAPAAAGVAALVKQAFPDLSSAELKAYLMANVTDLGDSGEDNLFGTGRIALPPPENNNTEAPISGKTPVTTEAKATFTDITPKFNVKFKGRLGFTITVSFELENFEGKELVVGVLFYDAATNKPLPAAVDDYNIGGVVGAGLRFKVKGRQTSFKDVAFFIDNEAFDATPRTVNSIAYKVVVLDPTDPKNPTVLAISEPKTFKISWD
ncbi:MAG: S8 family serine peptidase [Anaerolineales bacterium]|nr:S8 family serine peptidase [Anaerolineales bacterium]